MSLFIPADLPDHYVSLCIILRQQMCQTGRRSCDVYSLTVALLPSHLVISLLIFPPMHSPLFVGEEKGLARQSFSKYVAATLRGLA